MPSCIIIRGAAGVGKTTIAKELARITKSDYYSVDDVLEQNGLDTIIGDGIPADNFIKADDIILKNLNDEKTAVIDGCFYREEQLKHMKENCKKLHIFTLHANLPECKRRNARRSEPLPSDAVEQVYKLVYNIREGVIITTMNKTIRQIIKEILSYQD
ncbi:MAG: AAA family ATPase [Candidatus Nanoarchaeia archaeon]